MKRFTYRAKEQSTGKVIKGTIQAETERVAGKLLVDRGYVPESIKEEGGGIADKLTVVRHNVFDFIPLCTEKFDLVFADPPYALDGLDTLPDLIMGSGILHPGCYFILEHGSEHSFTSHPAFVKEKKYGRVHFSFFES